MSTDHDNDTNYFFRFRVFHLGTVSIHFDENSGNSYYNALCICSRVLINSKKNRNELSEVRRSSNFSVQRSGDHYMFSEDNITIPVNTVVKNISCENSADNIAVNANISNLDECDLIESDIENQASSYCCFPKMLRSIRRIFKRKKKKRFGANKNDTEDLTSSDEPVVARENSTENDNGISVIENLADDSPFEYSSKCPENGIKHMGFAYEESSLPKKPRISCQYDADRINSWNKFLILQPSQNNLSSALTTSSHIESLVAAASPLDPVDNLLSALSSSNHIESLVTTPLTLNPFTELEGLPISFGKRNQSNVKKRKKQKLNVEILPTEIMVDPTLKKYWANRYRLFSKFDSGIRLDAESWYSVTPEKISKHIADRCCCDIIVDGFCGAGGNTIQFAFSCERVIAVDIDPVKIKMAEHNAKIYGVHDRIEFIVGDFFKILPSLKADVVFLSPPWGGPLYNRELLFPLENICLPQGGKSIFEVARGVSEHIAFYLPRNINTGDILTLLKPGEKVELEQNLLSNKLVAITAYFGELADDFQTLTAT